jgi:hypothetical protein
MAMLNNQRINKRSYHVVGKLDVYLQLAPHENREYTKNRSAHHSLC